MTVTNLTTRVDYPGAGTAGPFDYTFRIFEDTDLLVTIRDTNDLETTLVFGDDYTVTGAGNAAGGTVTLLSTLAVGEVLTIRRVLPLTQDTTLRNQGTFFPETLEDALDRDVMIGQQIQEGLSGTVRLPETIDPDDFDPTLPVALTPLSALVVNAAGDGFDMGALTAAQLSAWSATHNITRDVFTSSGGFTPGVTTQLTLSAAPGNVANLFIVRRTSGVNVVYETDEFSIVGTTLTFTVAIPASTTRVEVRYLYTYQVNTALSQNVGYSQAGTGAAVQDVRAVLRRTVWVEDYGALGNDSTLNTTAIVNAEAALHAQGGGILQFGPGIFRTLKFSVHTYTWVRGVGQGATVIKCTSTAFDNVLEGLIYNVDPAGGNTHIYVTDLTIQRTVVQNDSFFAAIYLDNVQHYGIHNVDYLAAGVGATSPQGNKGFLTIGCKYGWITDNYLKNVPDSDISVDWSGSRSDGYAVINNNVMERTFSAAHSNIVISADHCSASGNIAIGANGNMFELGDAVDDVEIGPNNILKGSSASGAFLLAISGTNVNVHNNRGVTNAVTVLESSGGSAMSGWKINDNIFPDADINVTKSGSAFHDVEISGNTVLGISAQTITDIQITNNVTQNRVAKKGIESIACVNAIITGNTAHDHTLDGIYCELNVNDIVAFNQSYSNGGYGYYFSQPQKTTFRKNTDMGLANTLGYKHVAAATGAGPIPFLDVEFSDTGDVGSMYGNPGSVYTRTDGTGKASGVQFVKVTANTINTADISWLPVDLGGYGGDLAAAATTTLTAAKLHRLTGGTNVTTLTAGYAGRIVVLTSDGGGHHVVDGNNLKLSADWVPGPTDTLTLICDGTNWLEMCRSDN